MTPEEKQRLGKRAVNNGKGSVYSDILGLTFTADIGDTRAGRLEMMCSAMEYMAQSLIRG